MTFRDKLYLVALALVVTGCSPAPDKVHQKSMHNREPMSLI